VAAHINNIRDTTADDMWLVLRQVPRNLTGESTMKLTTEYAIPRLESNLMSHEHEGIRITTVLPRSALHMDM
jgi:hypothetical protein